jgi:hypothetical protein
MSATSDGPVLASYRELITELIEAGWAFAEIEDRVNEIAELDEDAKASLWLYAFSMADRTVRLAVP